jgi:hypothetical protein
MACSGRPACQSISEASRQTYRPTQALRLRREGFSTPPCGPPALRAKLSLCGADRASRNRSVTDHVFSRHKMWSTTFYARIGHVRICAGAAQRRASLPRSMCSPTVRIQILPNADTRVCSHARGKLIPSGNGSVRHNMRNLYNACWPPGPVRFRGPAFGIVARTEHCLSGVAVD